MSLITMLRTKFTGHRQAGDEGIRMDRGYQTSNTLRVYPHHYPTSNRVPVDWVYSTSNISVRAMVRSVRGCPCRPALNRGAGLPAIAAELLPAVCDVDWRIVDVG
jgi:hypothetical protein